MIDHTVIDWSQQPTPKHVAIVLNYSGNVHWVCGTTFDEKAGTYENEYITFYKSSSNFTVHQRPVA
jgi:hypothetical protein